MLEIGGNEPKFRTELTLAWYAEQSLSFCLIDGGLQGVWGKSGSSKDQ